MRAVVDKNICIGCGMCTGIAPDVFQMGEDGLAQAVAAGDDSAVQEAIASCPVAAISEE